VSLKQREKHGGNITGVISVKDAIKLGILKQADGKDEEKKTEKTTGTKVTKK